MTNNQYQLTIDEHTQIDMATAWLKLGVASLVFAGFFAILLVFARTPAIQEMIPFTDFFHVALVVHVDLSVLIWFISFAGVLWSLSVKSKTNIIDKTAIGLAVLGTLIIIIAPFFGAGKPLMNNYIPILDHPLFISGLVVFTVGMLLQILRTITAGLPKTSNPDSSDALVVAIYLSAWVALIAILSLFASYSGISEDFIGTRYYEMLFWGGGHVLQYTHTLLLLVAWFWIASASGVTINLSPRVAWWLFVLVALPVLSTPYIYQQYVVVSIEHRTAFTDLMKYGGLAVMVRSICNNIPTVNTTKPLINKG